MAITKLNGGTVRLFNDIENIGGETLIGPPQLTFIFNCDDSSNRLMDDLSELIDKYRVQVEPTKESEVPVKVSEKLLELLRKFSEAQRLKRENKT